MSELEDEKRQEIVEYEGGTLEVSREPSVVLAEAKKAATALKDVIEKKPKKVMFNGEQYLEFEDWQTVGKFYGVTAKVVSTQYVEFGSARGFEARAVALVYDKRTGETTERSAADAMCLSDEENWGMRPKYEWHYVKKSGGMSLADPGKDEIIWEATDKGNRPKKVKVQVGEVAVPLFQLRSMAQTRSCAKVLRNVLAWVVVLAGYRPTPAEELDYDRHRTDDQGEQESVSLPACPKCGKQKTVIEGKPEFGGGLVCWRMRGGCGHTWGQPEAEKPGNGQAGTAAGGTGLYQLTATHRLLQGYLEDHCDNDPKVMADMLETLTAWTDAKKAVHPGRRELSSISEKQAEYAIQHYEEQFGKKERRLV